MTEEIPAKSSQWVDDWPSEVKRTFGLTFRYRTIDGATVERQYIARETEHLNETFALALLGACLKEQKGWEISPHLVKRHFAFEELPPFGAKCIVWERLPQSEEPT